MHAQGPPTGAHLALLSMTPVKGTRVHHPTATPITPTGIPHDREFHVIRAKDGRQLSALTHKLRPVTATWEPDTGRLTVRLGDDEEPLEGTVQLGAERVGVVAWDDGREVNGREVHGPWSEALSAYLGDAVRLVMVTRPERAVDVAPITVVSVASIRRLSAAAGTELAADRFRLNLLIDGVSAHEEDGWYGRQVSVGDCVLTVTGPVPRCAMTTRDPMTGVRDVDVLAAIIGYRGAIEHPDTGELVEAPFGVYAQVSVPATVRVGDPVTVC